MMPLRLIACCLAMIAALAGPVLAQPSEPLPVAEHSADPVPLYVEAPEMTLRALLSEPDVVIDGDELRSYGSSFYEIEEPLALRAGIGFHATGDTASEDWLLVRGLPRDSSRNVL